MSSLQSSLKYWLCSGGKSKSLKRKGGHLDEPTSPATQRWTGDEDNVILQLTNPLHQVSERPQHVRKSAKALGSRMTAGKVTSTYPLSTNAPRYRSPPTQLSSDCRYEGVRKNSSGKLTGSAESTRPEDGVARERGLAKELDKCHIRSRPPNAAFSPPSRHSASASSSTSSSSSSSSTSAIVTDSGRPSSTMGFRSWREGIGSRHRERQVLGDLAEVPTQRHNNAEADEPSTDHSSVLSCEPGSINSGDSNLSLSSTLSSLCSKPDVDEGYREVRTKGVQKSATTSALNSHHVSLDRDSLSDLSDNEVASEESGTTKEMKRKEVSDVKKRRFGKILSRPLQRSQSAGCAKDVPAHALFLQHSLGEKGIDTLEERLGRPVTFQTAEEESRTESESSSRRPPPPHARPIHKTASADAAMMARDEYGNISAQSKNKKSLAKTMKKKLLFLRRRHTDTTLGTVMKGDGKQVSKIHPDDARQWSRSFDSLLLDQTGLELFRGFLRSEFSDENLEFWIAVEEFKLAKPSKVTEIAQKIYTDFVAPQAPREINLDSKTRMRTLANLSTPNKEVFEEAQRKVQALMAKDSYPRFLESDVYQRIIRSQKS